MKILLINAPREVLQKPAFPPLGLASIGAIASEEGHEIVIVDAADWDWPRLKQKISDVNPELVGLTCWTIERGQCFRTAHLVREVAPQAKIVVGGPHATAFPGHIFIKTPADYVVKGEGEETFRELLKALDSGKDIRRVRGLAYRNGETYTLTELRQLIQDLDKLPNIIHSQFAYDNYGGLHDTYLKSAAVITSRGCPFNCSFCSSAVYWGNKYRTRSVANVIREVESLYHDHGIRALLFFDDNLTIDRSRCLALSSALTDLKLDLVWAAEGSVKVDRELLAAMKLAGCYRLDFGVESGSPDVLKRINKPFSVDDTKRAFDLCRETGIRPNAYLIIGSPGETRESVSQTVRLMRDIQPDVCTPNPGIWILPDTDLYRMSLQQGIINEKDFLASDSTFIYTGEHSLSELESLRNLFARGMALGLGLVPYLRVVASQMFHSGLLKTAIILKVLRIFMRRQPLNDIQCCCCKKDIQV
ncbi:MAG: B12-binding domain-containing radical SAM protein [Chitinophagaceae bacterium]|nr:B12-binding domain-containing radical SAM protein [Chitinophagaceae bacterium]